MDVDIKVLKCGNCEELKLGVHGTALALAVVMGAYNSAAWLLRRERHLAVNSVMYGLLTAWEIQHVAHHWAEMKKKDQRRPAGAGAERPEEKVERAAA